ncbi:MAG: hypothetical protein NTW69_10535, partial [Chloroflexi bacterium]|nr:hypothetical protein [Chloroflexota bacterium]
ALSGTELNATASVQGIFLYSPAAGTVLNTGLGQILSVDFAPIDSINYNSVPGITVSINVNKATPIITWANPADITFGSALSGTELNATASVQGIFLYSPAAGTVLNPGAGQTLSVVFAPIDAANYNSVPGTTVSINVNKATPIITWANPADITFGSALSGTELNATASVEGTFVYNPSAGTVLNAGAGQILSVDFTPTDSVNNNSVLGTKVAINVNKATPTITWTNPADITFGSALSGTELNATASVPGTFAYTPSVGTVLNAGTGQTLSVDFTPTDSANYNNVLGTTVSINVNKATPTITWANPSDITFGSALSGIQLNATATVLGSFVYNPAAGTVLNAGAGQTLSVDFTPTDSVNYNSVLGTTVAVNVNKATPTITWTNPSDITFGSALSGIQLNATASVLGSFVYNPAAGTVLNAGAGQILSVNFTPTDSANYNTVLGKTVAINVNNVALTNTPGKVKGEGVVNNGRSRFIFKSEDKSSDIPNPFGELTFVDNGANISLKATSFTLQNISGKHALITGYATVNGKSNVAFTLDVYDNGRLGSSDTFMIQIPAMNGYSAGGVLESGNIQIEILTN